MTTGALYFFYKDKEDLFDCVVGPAAESVKAILLEHTMLEEEAIARDQIMDILEDIEVSKALIHFYYSNKEEAILLLRKSQGSSYENFVDDLVAIMEESSRILFEAIAKTQGHAMFTECTLHWFAHIQVESFLHVLSHDMPKEETLKQIEIVTTFLRGGYEKLIDAGKYFTDHLK